MLQRMRKVAAELSINVIIIAVLALVILAILIYLSSSKLGDFREAVDDCPNTEQNCVDVPSACPGPAVPMKCDVNNPKRQMYCCMQT